MSSRYEESEVNGFQNMLALAETGDLQYAVTRRLGGISINPYFFLAPDIANAVSAFVHPTLSIGKTSETFDAADLASTIQDDMPIEQAKALGDGLNYALNLSVVAGLVEADTENYSGDEPVQYRLTREGYNINPFRVQLVTGTDNRKFSNIAALAGAVSGAAIGASLGQPNLAVEAITGTVGGGIGILASQGVTEYLNRISFGRQAFRQSLEW